MTLPVKPKLTLEQAVRAYHATLQLVRALEQRPRRTDWDRVAMQSARARHREATHALSKAKEQR